MPKYPDPLDRPHYGPPVYIDPNTAAHSHNLVFDVERMGQNLKSDFPDITHEEWQQSIVCLTDSLPRGLAGVVISLPVLRQARGARFLYKLFDKSVQFLSNDVSLDLRTAEQMSLGRNVLVAINTHQFKPDELAQGLWSDMQNVGHADVLAHELQHAAVSIADLRHKLPNLEKLAKKANRTTAQLAALMAGVGTISTVALANAAGVSIDPALTNVGLMSGTSIIYGSSASLKYGWLTSDDHLNISPPLQRPYAAGEASADCYAIATRARWAGVLTVPSLDTSV